MKSIFLFIFSLAFSQAAFATSKVCPMLLGEPICDFQPVAVQAQVPVIDHGLDLQIGNNAQKLSAHSEQISALENTQSELWGEQIRLDAKADNAAAMGAALAGLPSAPDDRLFVGFSVSHVERDGYAITLQKGHGDWRFQFNAGASGSMKSGTVGVGYSF